MSNEYEQSNQIDAQNADLIPRIRSVRFRILISKVCRNATLAGVGLEIFTADFNQSIPTSRIVATIALGFSAASTYVRGRQLEHELLRLENAYQQESEHPVSYPVVAPESMAIPEQSHTPYFEVHPVVPHPTAPEDLYLYRPRAEQ